MRILVIRFSSLGDVVLASAPLRALADAHPGAEIVFATKEQYAPLFDEFEPKIHVVPLQPGQSLFDYRGSLGSRPFELIIDLHGSLRSHALCARLTTSELQRVHKQTLSRWQMVWCKKGLERPLSVVKSFLDTVNSNFTQYRPCLLLTSDEFLKVEQEYLDHPTTIGIGWGARHATKAVPAELWHALVARLHTEQSIHLRIFALETDRDDVERFQRAIRISGGTTVEFVINQPLRRTMTKLAPCRAFISSDSGLMHVADALGVPTFGLFGPTHPSLGFAPAGERSRAFHSGIWCSPCHRHGSAPCFRERRFCFDGLDVDQIAGAVMAAVESTPAVRPK